MIKGIYTSASGMQYLNLKQEIIANNLANISTTGFKKESAFRKTLRNIEKIIAMNAADFTNLEEIDIVRTDHSQGVFNVTNNPLDFCIEGSGFFAVETLNGTRYTRNGNFILDKRGSHYSPQHKTCRKGGAWHPRRWKPNSRCESSPSREYTR